MTRFNLISPRKKSDGGTYWHNVGTAFPRDKGGFTILLDSLPLPDAEGKLMLLMTEAERREERREERRDDRRDQRRGGYDDEPLSF